MGRPLKLGGQIFAVSLVAGLLALLAWRVAHNGGSHLAGDLRNGRTPQAPAFTLERLDGRGKVSLASLRGKAVVLNFWQAYCEPCKEEAPLLQAAQARWRNRGVVFVGVDLQDFTGDARAFARKYGMRYTLLHDGAGKTMGPFGVTGYPETFFISRTGKLVGRQIVGKLKNDYLEQYIPLALRS
jgi:cytochrome c biogenesis protein CcmG/thiol:disulfide interchange protein DsbE